MHDPMVVAFEIQSPFKRKSKLFPEGYRDSLVTIWHVDPERDGSDDSCGWSYPKLTEQQRKRIDGLAWAEAHNPWFQLMRAKVNNRPADSECLLRGAILLTARSLDVRLSFDNAAKLASELVHSPGDNFRSGLCLLPGYHTNSEKDTEFWREETAKGLFYGLARQILRERRQWWQSPRWHIHHWKIQIHAVQRFQRWAFSRCANCGKRFRYGEAPVSRSWDSDGPRWFRGEPNIYHSACERTSGVGQPVQAIDASD